MAGSGQRFYEDDEAEQILNLAASMSSADGRMSHDRLLETAAELGISPEAVEAAEKQVTFQRLDKKMRAEFDGIQRKELGAHLVSYLLFNGFFIFLCLGHGYFWAIWPILGWGIGLASHASATLFRGSSFYQEKYESWKANRLGLTGDQSAMNPLGSSSPSIVVGVHLGSGQCERLRTHKLARLERRQRIQEQREERLERHGRL